MLIVQLFIFAAFFVGFGLFSFLRKRKLIGFTFALLGMMLLAIASMTVYLYPDKWPF